jgi:uncharacterized membrane protein (UPF0127 family)
MPSKSNPPQGIRCVPRWGRPITRSGLGVLALCVMALSCAGKAENQEEGPRGPNPKLETAVMRVGPASLEVEIARSPEEREKGLMFRKSLDEGKGMLFVFEADQRLAFWMKNTTIPLSLAYIASDGTIRQILELEPGSLDPMASERSVRYALEVPRGWFERAGVTLGDRVEIPLRD